MSLSTSTAASSTLPPAHDWPLAGRTRRESNQARLRALDRTLGQPVTPDTPSRHLAHLRDLQHRRALLGAEVEVAGRLSALDLRPAARLPDRAVPTMRELDRLAMQASGKASRPSQAFKAVIRWASGETPRHPRVRELAVEAGKIYAALRTGANPGTNASYIRALKDAPTDGGFCITLADGTTISSQETPGAQLSLQSASKPIASATQALHPAPRAAAIGARPSPHAFNAPATLGNVHDPEAVRRANDEKLGGSFQGLRDELARHGDATPVNGMVNLGAVGVHDNIDAACAGSSWAGDLGELGKQHHFRKLILRMCARPGERPSVSTDPQVFDSELRDSDGNLKFAHLATARREPGVDGPRRMEMVWAAYASYIGACATRMSLADMAAMYHTLSNGGLNRYTGEQVVPLDVAAAVLEQMRVGGLYGASPAFTEATGLVAKTGVSGTGNYLSPQTGGRKGADFAIFSPPLDELGNSWLGGRFVGEVRALPAFKALQEAGMA